jgi:hypothetical protein
MKTVNLQINKKDTKTYVLTVKNNGVAVDVSGWHLYFSVKSDFNDTDVSAKLLKDITIPSNVDSQAGICYLPLTSAETNIDLGEFYYDIKLADTNYRETFMGGMLQIVQSIRTA